MLVGATPTRPLTAIATLTYVFPIEDTRFDLAESDEQSRSVAAQYLMLTQRGIR